MKTKLSYLDSAEAAQLEGITEILIKINRSAAAVHRFPPVSCRRVVMSAKHPAQMRDGGFRCQQCGQMTKSDARSLIGLRGLITDYGLRITGVPS